MTSPCEPQPFRTVWTKGHWTNGFQGLVAANRSSNHNAQTPHVYIVYRYMTIIIAIQIYASLLTILVFWFLLFTYFLKCHFLSFIFLCHIFWNANFQCMLKILCYVWILVCILHLIDLFALNRFKILRIMQVEIPERA